MKSVLVIDTPKTCTECRCHLWKVCVPADEDIDEYINPSTGKPNWCPLKPLPQKKEIELPWLYAEYENGWNDCIDEITGEKDESGV